jgi:hypothetical protein
MASTADQLAALANDPNFKARVMSLAMQQAGVVYAEDPATPNHINRSGFAKNVLNGGGQSIPGVLVNRANLVAGNTSYDFTTSHIKTDVTDAAIASQIATDWSMLAGV